MTGPIARRDTMVPGMPAKPLRPWKERRRDGISEFLAFGLSGERFALPLGSVREISCWALGEIDDVRAVSGLTAALKDRDGSVRDMAAWALGEIGSATAVDSLIGALKDPEWKVRAKAAWAIGEIADGRGANALAASLKDERAEVRQMAAWALAEVSEH